METGKKTRRTHAESASGKELSSPAPIKKQTPSITGGVKNRVMRKRKGNGKVMPVSARAAHGEGKGTPWQSRRHRGPVTISTWSSPRWFQQFTSPCTRSTGNGKWFTIRGTIPECLIVLRCVLLRIFCFRSSILGWHLHHYGLKFIKGVLRFHSPNRNT